MSPKLSPKPSKKTPSSQVLTDGVRRALAAYQEDLNGMPCTNLLRLVVPVVEKEVILYALHACGGNCSSAAKMLGVSRTTLNNKMLACQIKPKAVKDAVKDAKVTKASKTTKTATAAKAK